MLPDLFSDLPPPDGDLATAPLTAIDEGAVLIRGGIARHAEHLLSDIRALTAQAPLRRLYTPGGGLMSASLSCCGTVGWVSDQRGYRYQRTDPLSGRPWPALPAGWSQLAAQAAGRAGYAGFAPNSTLINRYGRRAEMGLHQDRNEGDFSAPIVSFSLGLSCLFLWGGPTRSQRPRRIPLTHGDVVVWGGPSRLFFHGIAPLPEGSHPLTGPCRYNLTFRRVSQ